VLEGEFPLVKSVALKPEEMSARGYADRLILEKLTQLHVAVKLSEIADLLQTEGIGLAAIRSLLASNPEKFAYAERRWVPAARIDGAGRPLHEAARLVVDRFGGPMPVALVVQEISQSRGIEPEVVEDTIRRFGVASDHFFITANDCVALAKWVFQATDETVERALAINGVTDIESVEAKLGDFDWRASGALEKALAKTGTVAVKTLGAVAWKALNPQAAHSALLYDWREFNSALLSLPGFVFGTDGTLTSDAEAKKWITAAVKLAEKLAPTVEIEDAAPIEMKSEDVGRMVTKIVANDESTTATRLLEEFYEITPSVKTFPDDMANIMSALRKDEKVWWVGGDRFRKPNSAPDFVYERPDIFDFVLSDNKDEEGEFVDCELTDEGLNTTLRKLLTHPLATDVNDEDILPAPKTMPEQMRLVLRPIHRELGTFPLSQIPTGWIEAEPTVQEIILIDPAGRQLQCWANMQARLIFGLIDWFYEQQVESGSVFSLTKTPKPNVFEFAWLDQTDPVVYITSQRMEELRTLQAESEAMSTLEILQTVMTHWPKGADFLTLLWEVSVVRRSSRRLVASLLSSYACFYQRSGSPVWHYDAKKVEQGFDKSKRKFVQKR
jgi:hypothetical protein